MTIGIINGPNLNLLGRRDPEIYGKETFEDTLTELKKNFTDITIQYFQTNSEGEIIDIIQNLNCDSNCTGIILNPGAYAHYSYAIADAIADSMIPVVEVHITNIHAREEFRAKSVTAREADAVLTGFGRDGYKLAINYLIGNQS